MCESKAKEKDPHEKPPNCSFCFLSDSDTLFTVLDDFLLFLTSDLVDSSVLAIAVSEVVGTGSDILDRAVGSVVRDVVLVFTVLYAHTTMIHQSPGKSDEPARASVPRGPLRIPRNF